MKRTLVGVGLLLSSTLMNIALFFMIISKSKEIMEWTSMSGKYVETILENGLLLPFIFVQLLFLLSLTILTVEYFKKD